MSESIIKIKCNTPECDGYHYMEINKHFDGKCNICDKTTVELQSPSIPEILQFAQFELENANYHSITSIPETLFKNITEKIILAPNEEKILATIIALTFYKAV